MFIEGDAYEVSDGGVLTITIGETGNKHYLAPGRWIELWVGPRERPIFYLSSLGLRVLLERAGLVAHLLLRLLLVSGAADGRPVMWQIAAGHSTARLSRSSATHRTMLSVKSVPE